MKKKSDACTTTTKRSLQAGEMKTLERFPRCVPTEPGDAEAFGYITTSWCVCITHTAFTRLSTLLLCAACENKEKLQI